MIPQPELANLRAEWMLDQNVIEKDYVLGWLLAGIAHQEELGAHLGVQGRYVPAEVLLRDLPILGGSRLHHHRRWPRRTRRPDEGLRRNRLVGARGVRRRSGARRDVLPTQAEQARQADDARADRLSRSEREPADAEGKAGPDVRRGAGGPAGASCDRPPLQRSEHAATRRRHLLLDRRAIRREAPGTR